MVIEKCGYLVRFTTATGGAFSIRFIKHLTLFLGILTVRVCFPS
ncbi:hypothetical protein ACUY3P_11595 [Corynebacterium lehmanniae]